MADVIADVGFGFGKTVKHNYALLDALDQFQELQCPILAGVSRKSMIQRVLDTNSQHALNGTTPCTLGRDRGAHLLRAHDVAEAKEVVALHHALVQSRTLTRHDPILFELWEAIAPFLTLGKSDLALVGLIVFYVYRLTKGTSAIPVFMGLLAIYLIWKLVTLMGMRFMGEILGQFIAVGILAIIIVFQQELRQFLFSIGDRASLKAPPGGSQVAAATQPESRKAFPVEEVVRALDRLSSRKKVPSSLQRVRPDLPHPKPQTCGRHLRATH